MSIERKLQYKPLTKNELEELDLTKREYRKVQQIVKKYQKVKINKDNPGIYVDCLYEGINVPEEFIENEIELEEEKRKRKNLEREAIKDSLINISKIITYPTLGINFILPTMVRKGHFVDKGLEKISIIGGVVESLLIYLTLSSYCPETIPLVAGTQIATNVISGIYEFIRNVKNKTAKNLRNIYVMNEKN